VSVWEGADDFVRLSRSLDGGAYQTVLCFAGGGSPSGTDLARDADCDGTGDAGGTALVEALATFTVALPGTGSVLALRLAVSSNAGSEELAFDRLLVSEGDPDQIFADDFESGGTGNWSSQTPP
jgi:hypothetical protein